MIDLQNVIVAASVVTTFVILPIKQKPLTRKDLEERYEEIVSKLPKLRYVELCELLNDKANPNLWDHAFGAGGQVSRIRRAILLLQLVQLRHSEGATTKQEAWLAWRRLLGQSFYTAISLVCLPVRRLRDKAALKSIELHCALILRTNTICVTNGSPKCLLRLDELL